MRHASRNDLERVAQGFFFELSFSNFEAVESRDSLDSLDLLDLLELGMIYYKVDCEVRNWLW